MIRTQISLDPEQHARAKARAAELGISLAGYIRRLIDRDVDAPPPATSAEAVFDLGDSGGSDVARHEDEYLGAAVAAEHERSSSGEG